LKNYFPRGGFERSPPNCLPEVILLLDIRKFPALGVVLLSPWGKKYSIKSKYFLPRREDFSYF